MAHFASKRFSYAGQLGILLGFAGVGFIVAAVASAIPLLSKINLADISKLNEKFIESLMVPENANMFRWMQFITTFFAFFLPPVCYAWLCHKKAALHLGLKNNIDIKQVSLTLAIMLACLPLVGALQNLTEMLPWSKAMLQKFKEAEANYAKQVAVIARMNGFGDYIISIVMIALLPAFFEEVAFRGGLQNLLTRWIKSPVIAIVLTSVLFSAIHMSYLGFLSRFVLGFVLGWIFYKTGNLWLTIIAHFFNNAMGVTVIYLSSKPGQPIDAAALEDTVPLWAGALSLVATIALLVVFEKLVKKDIDKPGEEVLLADENASMFAAVNNIGNNNENINGTVQH